LRGLDSEGEVRELSGTRTLGTQGERMSSGLRGESTAEKEREREFIRVSERE
jgi:hypothetical protein